MLEDFQDVLTVDEACEALRIGIQAMYEILNTGKLKAYRNGPGVADSKGRCARFYFAACQSIKLMKRTQGYSLRPSLIIPIYLPEESP